MSSRLEASPIVAQLRPRGGGLRGTNSDPAATGPAVEKSDKLGPVGAPVSVPAAVPEPLALAAAC
ncbi:MAG: hypothetical protein ACR2RL_03755, partial [Gammaproteobacteria bacterium]